ncbi:DUF6640 family protein [Pendulispora albinea]|uniref:Acetyltransferase n=1 Tax=Pendulispora albinea TaxID=2741071 RepID=A0ABZ2LPZ1_9BACT
MKPRELPRSARILTGLVALVTMVGPYLADWNETHIYNPTWPPHAKFHNAQTMLMGAALGACTLYFLRGGSGARPRFTVAVLLAALYWITQALSILFPGTAFVDPDRAGTGLVAGVPVQFVLDVVLLALLGVAMGLRAAAASR